jgi:hypothetical protein
MAAIYKAEDGTEHNIDDMDAPVKEVFELLAQVVTELSALKKKILILDKSRKGLVDELNLLVKS